MTPAEVDVERAVATALDLAASGGRTLLGITGPPGAGKSTLAGRVVTAVNAACPEAAALVPMDGFHYAQAELVRLGRADRKGAPDTFDAAGFLALLRRLRANDEPVVYAPRFHREIEEAVNASIPVERTIALVVIEGNYLLMDGPWAPVRDLLDACWYVEVDDDVRVAQLIDRHIHHGRSPDAARAWVLRSDEANAREVACTRSRAQLVVRRPA